MAATREYPDVSLEIRQELNLDVLAIRRHEIAERVHRVVARPLGSHIAQRVARARSDHAGLGFERAVAGLETPTITLALDIEDSCLLDLNPGVRGSLEQHAIEVRPRIDDQRPGE